MPTFTIVGLPDASVQESRERVRAAIRNSNLTYPFNKRITVNLAPADLRKEGPAYDLSIAVALLLASEQLAADLSQALIIGELSLDGVVRHTNGCSRWPHWRGIGVQIPFCPGERHAGSGPHSGLDVYPIESLFAFAAHWQGLQPISPYRPDRTFEPRGRAGVCLRFLRSAWTGTCQAGPGDCRGWTA